MYGEKRIQVDGPIGADGNPMKLEYRVWNPFRSKLAAAILGDYSYRRSILFTPTHTCFVILKFVDDLIVLHLILPQLLTDPLHTLYTELMLPTVRCVPTSSKLLYAFAMSIYPFRVPVKLNC